MNDRELLEKAARAAGIEVHDWLPGRHGFAIADGPYRGARWNPLADDGDALRLAVKLRLDVLHWAAAAKNEWPAHVQSYCSTRDYCDCIEEIGSDPYAATRRAIVRAAAAMDKGE